MLSLMVVAATALQLQTVTLDDAVRTALSQHPELRMASAGVEVARTRVRSVRAGLFPTLGLSARYGLSAGPEAPGGTFWSADGAQSYSAGLSGSLLLWDFGRTSDRVEAAEAGVEIELRSRDATTRGIVLEVELGYYEALARRRLAQVAAETLASEERHLGEIEQLVAVGARPPIDLARARTTVASARSQVVSADNAYALARAGLASAMGVASSDFEVAEVVAPALAGESDATARMLTVALERRPELAGLRASMQAQRLTIRQAEHALYPTLRLGADTSYAGSEFEDPRWGASVGLTLSWTLYDGGAAAASASAERLSLIVLDAQQEALRRAVELQLTQARLEVSSAKAAGAAAAEQTTAATELLRLAEERYRAGVGNVIELGDAQVAASNAAAGEVAAAVQLSSARARLKWALGL